LSAFPSGSTPGGRPFGGEWDWARNAARLYARRPFLDADGQAFTFGEWSRRVDRVAGFLSAQGLKPGDRAGILLPAGVQAAELVFAAIRAGIVLVPVNTRLHPAEVERLLSDAQPQLVLVADTLRDRLSVGSGRAAVVTLGPFGADPERDPLLGDARGWAFEPGPEQIQSLIYTSGTTGSPKGAVLTLGQHWWNAVGSSLRLGHDPRDVWLLCLPLFHVGGQAILFRAAIGGNRVILEPRFDAGRVARWLSSGEVTLVSLVPTMLQRVLDAAVAPFSPRVRAVLLGGAAVAPALLERGRQAGLPLVPTYGMTETGSQMATVDPLDDDPRVGARPLYAADIDIFAPDAEGVGEIRVRGPQVSPGYWVGGRLQEESGWLLTGDLGRLDEEGRLLVLDRRADLIVSGGENIYPAEIEAALLQDPRVTRAAVVPVADPTWGQVPAAAVVLAAGATADAEALSQALRTRLASFKIPRHWKVVREIPETANGKILRRAVQGWFGEADA
jgi:O-succinylbenzoic acid--CoA ligase